MSDDKPLIVVGTSGSTDYLRDGAGAQRFWPAHPEPSMIDLREICDGLHDDDAPIQYLCTRCFPDLVDRSLGRDLLQAEDDECVEDPRHEDA